MSRSDSFSRLPAVMARFGMSRAMVYKLMTAGRFPRPRKIGQISVWLDADLDRFANEISADGNETKEAV